MRPEAQRRKKAQEQIREKERSRIMAIEDPNRRAYELKRFEDFSVYREMIPFLPANVKQFVYDILGGKKSFDINDLTDKEVTLVQELILPLVPEDAKPGDVIPIGYDVWDTTEPGNQYSDITRPKSSWQVKVDDEIKNWGDLTEEEQRKAEITAEEKYGGGITTPTDKNMFQLMLDPKFRLKTLIGGAQIIINEQGQPVLVDQFNYNRPEDEDMGNVKKRPLYNIPRMIGGMLGSQEGEGSRINLVIPPLKQNKYKAGGTLDKPLEGNKREIM